MKRIQNKNFLRQFSPDRPYLVAVSGGRDSVALLDWLIESGYKKLIVCHFNHRLRGRVSDADARFVEKLVARYKEKIAGQAHRLPPSERGKRSACPTTTKIEFELGQADVRGLAAKNKLSIEATAREARYKFFARTAKRNSCHTIFVGHHADDLVETFLINLFRGSGTAGLAGIREISRRKIDNVDLTVVRPFLGIWRGEIDRYVRTRRLKFREDASNKDLGPLRNRIRHWVIPYLEKTVGRNIQQSIWRTAMIAAEEEAWIDQQLANSTDVNLPVVQLRNLPIAIQRRQILKWLRSQNISDVGFDVVENVRALLDHDSGPAKVNVSRDRHVRRRSGKIFIAD